MQDKELLLGSQRPTILALITLTKKGAVIQWEIIKALFEHSIVQYVRPKGS